MNPAALRSAEAFGYRLPLAQPLVMPSGTHAEREGVLLRLTAEDGSVGWGEATPLPGYSPDTLDDVLTFLGAWTRGEPTARILSPGAPPPDPRALAAIPTDSPAALWAIVQAGAEVEARQTGRSLSEVYAQRGPRGAPRPTVALNALLLGDGDAVLGAARQAAAAGYGAAKLKVGGLAPTAAAHWAARVGEALGEVALRLDANRAWSLDQATAFAEALDGVEIDYVEEPLSDPSELPELARRTTLRWALDESLLQAAADPALAAALGAAVVKPMLGPGLVWWASSEMSGLWSRRRTAGPVVVSSVFESGVGMRHLVALAAALGDAPAGLDTYRWLAADVLDRRLPLAGPTVDVAAVLSPNPVRLDRLTPLDL